MVYLVGAGPGDSGLITQKGLECIKKSGRHNLRPPCKSDFIELCKKRL